MSQSVLKTINARDVFCINPLKYDKISKSQFGERVLDWFNKPNDQVEKFLKSFFGSDSIKLKKVTIFKSSLGDYQSRFHYEEAK